MRHMNAEELRVLQNLHGRRLEPDKIIEMVEEELKKENLPHISAKDIVLLALINGHLKKGEDGKFGL